MKDWPPLFMHCGILAKDPTAASHFVFSFEDRVMFAHIKPDDAFSSEEERIGLKCVRCNNETKNVS